MGKSRSQLIAGTAVLAAASQIVRAQALENRFTGVPPMT